MPLTHSLTLASLPSAYYVYQLNKTDFFYAHPLTSCVWVSVVLEQENFSTIDSKISSIGERKREKAHEIICEERKRLSDFESKMSAVVQ